MIDELTAFEQITLDIRLYCNKELKKPKRILMSCEMFNDLIEELSTNRSELIVSLDKIRTPYADVFVEPCRHLARNATIIKQE